jgi:hypothetical protein
MFAIFLITSCIGLSMASKQMLTLVILDHGGLVIEVNVPFRVDPGETVNFTVILSSKAEKIYIDYLHFNITSFLGENQTINIESFSDINGVILPYGNSTSYNYTIVIPEDAKWIVQGTFWAKWCIEGVHPDWKSPPPVSHPLMFITDVYYRELKQKISELQQELDALNSSYVDLENSYIDLKNNLNALNSSYIDLKNNYTALNSTYYEKLRELESSKGELGAVRQLAIIFGVTTTFFVITTLYLFKRRPGQIW